MLPKAIQRRTQLKNTWRRKWRAKQKQAEAEDGQGPEDGELGDPDPDEDEARDGEVGA